MKKTFCDVCGKETGSGRRKTLAEIEQVLEAADIYDICEPCMKAVEESNFPGLLRNLIAEIGKKAGSAYER